MRLTPPKPVSLGSKIAVRLKLISGIIAIYERSNTGYM